MNGLEFLGMVMLIVMLFAIFIGIPIAARSRSERIGDSVLQRCFTRGSDQQTPYSSGSSGSYSSVTW